MVHYMRGTVAAGSGMRNLLDGEGAEGNGGKQMKILIACEFLGVVRRAFEAKGHDVISCDLLPADDNSPYHCQGPVEDLLEQGGGFDLMIAHPPCKIGRASCRERVSSPV